MINKRFSKDPKTIIVSLKDFYEHSDYLIGCEDYIGDTSYQPEPFSFFYKFTKKYLLCVHYSGKSVNFGMDEVEKLDLIEIAIRDGHTEYELIDDKLKELEKEQLKHKYSKKISNQIDGIKHSKDYLPPFEDIVIQRKKSSFKDYLVDVGYKTKYENLKNKAIVIDVETNGLRRSNDDLLSISIYDPNTGMCYNRFFPLDLQPLVLTTFVHGIEDEDLENTTHWTQDEVNELIEYFHMKDRYVLSYSGGQGTFDSTFVINYCKRHNITGFEDLKYLNIKNYVPDGAYGTEGQFTKDNLCRLFKIEGVKDTHTSMNDCILEWKLFEKFINEQVFFIDKHLFKYNPNYIIPVTYLNQYPCLKKYAKLDVPYIEGKAKKLIEYKLPKKILKDIKKFQTNITGITLENGIDYLLNVEEQDNYKFLLDNKKQLEYIGSLDSSITEIPVMNDGKGRLISLDHEYDEEVKEVNNVTDKIMKSINSIIDYIKNDIFNGTKILSQEMVISEDKKILSLCDLSNNKKVLEIKTYHVLKEEDKIKDQLAQQLYYQARGRETYCLSIEFKEHLNKKLDFILDDVVFTLYKVELNIVDKPERIIVLRDFEIKILDAIKENPTITQTELANMLDFSKKTIATLIKRLKALGYISKDKDDWRCPWNLLRDSSDKITKLE